MSKQVALTSLSKRFHFTPPSSLSSEARRSSAPRLILLFAWMGARLSHAQKYVNGYHEIWPSTPIILVQSLPQDFRPFSGYAREYSALVSLLGQHSLDLTDPEDGKDVLMVTMSNGGCWGIDALLHSLPKSAILRPRALVLDSCPGLARYSVTLKAFLIAGKYRLFRKAIATVVITLYYCLSVIFNKVTGRDPIGHMRLAMIDRIVAQRRAYVYSKEDDLIYWKDVEAHSAEVHKARQTTKLELFVGSPHVMHLRSDEERYWRIVQETWDPSSSNAKIHAPEPEKTEPQPTKSSTAQDGIQSSPQDVNAQKGLKEDSYLNESYVDASLSLHEESVSECNEEAPPSSAKAEATDQVSNHSSYVAATSSTLSTDSTSSTSEDLDPSILGTKEYWEEIYRRERANYAENTEDEGEIWFGEEAEDKIVAYLQRNHPQDKKLRILDLGTGNGHLLFKLHEEGFVKWDMVGIDYSEHSIELARAIARTRSTNNVRFLVQDFLSESAAHGPSKFDVVIDKGTFDAISLSDQRTPNGKKLNEIYAVSVARYMKPDAKLVITSCNWTTEELIQRLTSDNILKVHAYFKKPKQFSFGGSTGTTTSSVCFALARQ